MSESPLRVKFDASDFEALGQEFTVFKGEVQESVRRAVRSTTDRLRDETISEFVKVSGLRVTAIRKRMFLRYRYKDGYGRIWWGLSPVSLSLLSPRRSGGGVRAGPVMVPGGFMAPEFAGKSVFKRTGERRVMKSGRYKGRVRESISKQYYDIKDMGEDVIRQKIEPVINSIFQEELREELVGAITSTTRTKRRTTKRFSR